jgi:hypothetical protein
VPDRHAGTSDRPALKDQAGVKELGQTPREVLGQKQLCPESDWNEKQIQQFGVFCREVKKYPF